MNVEKLNVFKFENLVPKKQSNKLVRCGDLKE
jgi:hypothetical protein